MGISAYIPAWIKDYLRLHMVRRRYPQCAIHTPRVAGDAVLGRACTLAPQVEVGPGVRIGDYSYLNTGSIIASGCVGKFSSIGYYCQIGMPEHPITFLSTSPRTYGKRNIFDIAPYWQDIVNPPSIGHDVWIGSHAVVLQGIVIGDGAVIAAGAVVTKDVPPYAIVGGVPAKVLRYRFPDAIIERLLTWRWWDLPEGELHALAPIFTQGAGWINALPDNLPSGGASS